MQPLPTGCIPRSAAIAGWGHPWRCAERSPLLWRRISRAPSIELIAAGLAAVRVAWQVLFKMEIGPVVFVVSECRGCGVHGGDVPAVVLFALGAALAITGLVVAAHAATIATSPVLLRRAPTLRSARRHR